MFYWQITKYDPKIQIFMGRTMRVETPNTSTYGKKLILKLSISEDVVYDGPLKSTMKQDY